MPTINLTGWLQSMSSATSRAQKILDSPTLWKRGVAHNQLATETPTGAMMWKSTSGIVFILAGGPIYWSTQKQGRIATSTCEAELNSFKEAAKRAHYLLELLLELGLLQDTLFNDNQSAPAAIKRPGGGKHRWTKLKGSVEWWEIPMSSFSGFPAD